MGPFQSALLSSQPSDEYGRGPDMLALHFSTLLSVVCFEFFVDGSINRREVSENREQTAIAPFLEERSPHRFSFV